MPDKQLSSIRDGLRSVLQKVRAEGEALVKKQKGLDPRWSDQAKREAMTAWRAEIGSKVASMTANVTELTKAGLGAQDRWSVREYLRRQPLTTSTGSDKTQSAILEELTQLRMAQALPRLTAEELGRRTDDAIAGQKWGELGVILTEVEDRRRSHPDAFEWPLLIVTIEKVEPPEVAAARETVQEIRYLSQWIVSATSAIASGSEDFGLAQEQSFLATAEKEAGDHAAAKARMRPYMESPTYKPAA